ncbi:conjugal transfer peptidase TraF (plasmid) [Campylobacter iguaniorum]|uniref:Signal peptidase I n=1 Tax=Campylobacter iguaniorum TaxID=1244531 RepID=A0A076FD06_9BACT|nr:signal peptidase I [Campylobacter iguaniorum]AII15528.1 conjugal transfer peptidase TraF [Campylobacter iguaniorum]
MNEKMKKFIKYVAAGIVIFGIGNLALSAIGSKYGLGIIVTKSLDKDYFIFQRDWQGKIAKGEIIYFSLPIETPYYKKASKFGKIIMCEGGDKLSTQGLDYYCNNKFIGTAKTTDKNGKPVSPFIYNGEIPQGSFFVMGTHERSYDSRYWGFVNEDQIQGIAIWSI